MVEKIVIQYTDTPNTLVTKLQSVSYVVYNTRMKDYSTNSTTDSDINCGDFKS